MRHIPLTPFGRQPVTACLLETHALAEAHAPHTAPDKWALLRDLIAARAAFGVSDRDLAVLSALLSFHPYKQLDDDKALVVFPSNASLSQRAHGMAESTLRRHLAALANAGLILRRDSPNGKRYVTRGPAGIKHAFGFELRPLLIRSAEIAESAALARQAELEYRRKREEVVLYLRDAGKLIVWGRDNATTEWDKLSDQHALMQRLLRRKLNMDELTVLADKACTLLSQIKLLTMVEPEEMVANDAQNERHHQNSKPETYESETCGENQKQAGTLLPLSIVLKAAPEIRDYAPDIIRNWTDLIRAADFIRPMLGIMPECWRQTCTIMGRETASVVLACILQRASVILNPGGYLRSLTEKAASGGFSPGPMVMALVRAEGKSS